MARCHTDPCVTAACPRCKVVTPIVKGSHSAMADNLPVARVGDVTGCGATIKTGSADHRADGLPVAYLGSVTFHGGAIITGSSTIKVAP
ncbi:hypothetical protein DC366_12930 [Pelagivirga sediminicola]|uniref:PAAR domain-containing protein n=1 Tax=Pelagivirga sediminicola TaxID=2170575 RepID=A0A2T7G599_9RHOB|nr:PAAR domain-containing protein [Pelagivirga sediminicola]PVA09591.1 hypothetical protein DC366_12930 [Pelagivirga sediminicola]